MPNPFAQPSKTKRFLKVLKVIFLSKLPMNLFFLLLIIGLSIAGFNYITPGDTPTGNVILEQECPECIYEQAQETECEQDCSLCPIKTKIETKNIIYYSCPWGELVSDLDDCSASFPEVPEEYSGTVEGITLIIDNIEYEQDEEDSGFVTRVDYTIINKGDLAIVPKIEVKVYENWNLKTKKSVANKVIHPEIVVVPNDYVKRKDRVRIYFRGEEQTLRLLLVDSLPAIERDIVAVTRDFDLDYAD